jgi:hypothetical protein
VSELNQFYILAHISISFIGAVLLLALWYNINKSFKRLLDEDGNQKRLDKGLFYISLSLFVWVVSGAWALLAAYQGFAGGIIHQIGINLLSTLNNLFLLLALFYFLEAPKFIYHNIKNLKNVIWALIVLAIISVSLALFSNNQPILGMRLGNLPDFILSGFLSILLLSTLYKTFFRRGLQIVAVISVVSISLMFLSQLSEVFVGLDNMFSDNLIKIVAKTSLIATFLVLATTWVIQLANTPRQDEMSMQFMDWSLIKVTIPSKNIINQEVDFGSKLIQFKNLLKFALRRKYGEGSDQCIVVNAGGEIKSQAYLSRIIDNLNEILAKEDDQKLERKDLFTFVGQSQYRLRFLAENIKIDQALLEEFIQDDEQVEYRMLVGNSAVKAQ